MQYNQSRGKRCEISRLPIARSSLCRPRKLLVSLDLIPKIRDKLLDKGTPAMGTGIHASSVDVRALGVLNHKSSEAPVNTSGRVAVSQVRDLLVIASVPIGQQH